MLKLKSFALRSLSLPFLGILIFLCIRSADRIIHPTLWAEDGMIFLKQAYDGVSVLSYYQGYLHVLPRLLAATLILLFPNLTPIYELVVLKTFLCMVVAAICLGYFTTDRFTELVMESKIRWLVAVCFCLSPGLIEVLGNLANLHWLCSFFLFLVTIRNQESKLALPELVFSTLCILTAGESAILLPIFLLRTFKNRKMPKANRNGDFLIILIIVLVGLSNWINSHQTGNIHSQVSSLTILATTYRGLVNRIFLLPLFGFRLTSNIGKFAPGVALGITFSIFLLYIKKILQPSRTQLKLLCLSIYLVSIVPLMCVARGDVISLILGQSTLNPDPNFGGRYAFVLGPYAILFWIMLLKSSQFDKTSRKSFSFLSIYALFAVMSNFFIGRLDDPEISWQKVNDSIITESRNPLGGHVLVPVTPTEWSFWLNLRAPR